MNSASRAIGKNASVRGAERLRSSLRRFPIARFLVSLVLAIMFGAFADSFRGGEFVEGLLLSSIMLLALPALGGHPRTLAWGISLVTPALVGKWLNHLHPSLATPVAFLGPAFLFVAFVVLNLLRFVLRSPRVDSEVLCAGIAGYLLLGLLWAFAYILVARLFPDSFVFNAGPQSMKGFTAM